MNRPGFTESLGQVRGIAQSISDARTKISDDARGLLVNIAQNYPDVYNSLSSEEFLSIRNGVIPDQVYVKISQSAEQQRQY